MTRNLVFCTDGTWNRPDQRDRDRVVPSNVLTLYVGRQCVVRQQPHTDPSRELREPQLPSTLQLQPTRSRRSVQWQ